MTFLDRFGQRSCYKIAVHTSADFLRHRFLTVNGRRHYARPGDDVIARVTSLGLCRRRRTRGKRAGRRCRAATTTTSTTPRPLHSLGGESHLHHGPLRANWLHVASQQTEAVHSVSLISSRVLYYSDSAAAEPIYEGDVDELNGIDSKYETQGITCGSFVLSPALCCSPQSEPDASFDSNVSDFCVRQLFSNSPCTLSRCNTSIVHDLFDASADDIPIRPCL